MRENFTKGLLIKIMDSNFQEIKEKLNLEEIIIRETGIVRKGPHMETCFSCGGHDCFSIKDNRFKCFQCDIEGDVFTFLQKYKGLDVHASLKYAAGLLRHHS